MRIGTVIAIVALSVFGMGLLAPGFAQETKPIKLPQPELNKGKLLMQALKDRSTSRKYSSGNISQQTLSNLLWAAFGISRPETGKRTAPSAYNRQEIDVYVAMAQGLYLYDPKENLLKPVVLKDLRTLTGTQSYFKDATLNLVYVADLSKMGEGEEQRKMYIAGTDTGFIGQNVYLFCASQGLATVFRASIDRKKLGEAMKLRPNQRITFAQTVGLPAPGK